MMSSFFRSKWGIRLVLFVFLVVAWFGLQMYQRTKYRYQPAADVGSAPAPTRSLEEIRATWRREVERVLGVYDREKEATKARDALLALTVGREDQETHLRLVLGLNGLIEQAPEALQKWQAARKAFEQP